MTPAEFEAHRHESPALAAEIERLLEQLRQAGEQLETANRNHDDLRANCARVVERNESLRTILREARDCATYLAGATVNEKLRENALNRFEALLPKIGDALEQKVR